MEPIRLEPPEDLPPLSAEYLVDGRQMTPEEEAEVEERRYPSTIGGAFYLGVLAVAVVALLTVVFGSWLWGITLLGVTLIVAAVLRWRLNPLDAGMLAVRSRWIDVLLLTTAGVLLIGLAWWLDHAPNV